MQNRIIILIKMSEMAQQLRECTRFCGGPKFSPRTHIKHLITTYNSSFIRSDIPCLCGHLPSHAHTGTHIHIIKNKYEEELKLICMLYDEVIIINK